MELIGPIIRSVQLLIFIGFIFYYINEYVSQKTIYSNPINDISSFNFDNTSVALINKNTLTINHQNDSQVFHFAYPEIINDQLSILKQKNVPIKFATDENDISILSTIWNIIYIFAIISVVDFIMQFVYSSVMHLYKKFNPNKDGKKDPEDDTIFKLAMNGPMDASERVFRVYEKEELKERFTDIIGMKDCKDELSQVVDMLNNRDKYTSSGALVPRGALLIGPPGTGKTMMAKAMAGECGMTFITCTGSDFNEIFVGSGSKRVRDLFEMARKKSPSVIFIDEIDALGKRTENLINSNSTINKILSEMDGFDPNENIFVMGATNIKDNLDKAIMRSGRFDMKVFFDYPNKEERYNLFDLYLKKVRLSKEIKNSMEKSVNSLSESSFQLTGADIKNITQIAARKFILKLDDKEKLNKDEFNHLGITMKHLHDATDEVIIGKKKRERIMNDTEKLTTAFHEIGHAIVGKHLKETANPVKVSIIPRGEAALGVTVSSFDEDKKNYTLLELVGRMAVAFGGQMGEYILNGEYSNGAYSDLNEIFNIIGSLHKQFGSFNEQLIKIVKEYNIEHTKQTDLGKVFIKRDKEMDDELHELIQGFATLARNVAYQILCHNHKQLAKMSIKLVEEEEFDKDTFNELYEKYTPVTEEYSVRTINAISVLPIKESINLTEIQEKINPIIEEWKKKQKTKTIEAKEIDKSILDEDFELEEEEKDEKLFEEVSDESEKEG